MLQCRRFKNETFFLLLGHQNVRICVEKAKLCVHAIENAFNDPASSTYKSCDCLNDCNAVKYVYELQADKISPRHLQNYTESGDFALESEVSIYLASAEFEGVLTNFSIITFDKIIFLRLRSGTFQVSTLAAFFHILAPFFGCFWAHRCYPSLK